MNGLLKAERELIKAIDLEESAIELVLDNFESLVKKSRESKQEDSMEEQLKKSRERVERLRDLSLKLRALDNETLESITFYKKEKSNIDKVAIEENKLNQVSIEILIGFNRLNDFDIIRHARQGFPKRVLLALAKKISLNIQELANILHISERTLQRYDDDAIIKTEYAEKAVELARLYTRGEEVFGSMDKFKIWIKTPGHVFKGEAPVTILDTSAGFDMVFKELGRIEHGIFA